MTFTIHHVNINVKDIDASIQFYGEAFGLKEVHRNTAEDGSS